MDILTGMAEVWPRWEVLPGDLKVFLLSAWESHKLAPSETDQSGVTYDKPGDVSGRRIHTSLGRFIRKRRPDCTVDDHTIAIWAGVLFGAAVESTCLLELYTGADVSKMYRELARDFSLTSCMGKAAREGSLTSLYDLNPGWVGLLVYPGHARALLWSEGGNGFGEEATEFYLDRIYGRRVSKNGCSWDSEIEHEDCRLLSDAFASSKWRAKTIGSHNGVYGRDTIRRVTMHHNGVMPYMDTFDTGESPDDNDIINMYSDQSGDCRFEDTCGGWEGSGYVCSCCDERCDEDDGYWHGGDFYCESCFWDSHFACGRCGDYFDSGNDEVYHDGDTYCSYCAERIGLESCADCGEVYKRDGMVYVEDSGFVCERCFDRGNYFRCEECGEVHDGEGNEVGSQVYCASCADSKFDLCECCRKFVDEDLTSGRCESCHEDWRAARDAEIEELKLAEARESMVDLPYAAS